MEGAEETDDDGEGGGSVTFESEDVVTVSAVDVRVVTIVTFDVNCGHGERGKYPSTKRLMEFVIRMVGTVAIISHFISLHLRPMVFQFYYSGTMPSSNIVTEFIVHRKTNQSQAAISISYIDRELFVLN